MTKRILTLALVLASFAALAPAAVVYGGYGYGRPYVGPRYYYGPRVYAAPYVAPYVAPAPVYVGPYYRYGYRYGYAPRYHGGGYRYYRGYRR
ncbi:MAG TPA: hypothetical protein VMT15_11655 [Bryobacteraceae bacterium]|nr:hypothetical protein [Bryobacteraceae bacterium]